MSETTPTPDETPDRTPKQASKVEIAQRIEEIMVIRLSGAGFHDVRNYATEKGWAVSRAQLYRYMQEADARIIDSLDKDRPNLLHLHVARRQRLFARCQASGDWRAALAVLKDEAELCGLYPAKKAELTGKDGSPLELVVKRVGGEARMEDL